MLSGGFDSSSIASVAATLLEKEQRSLSTFTEVPSLSLAQGIVENRYPDAPPYIQALTRQHPNIIPHFVRVPGFYLNNLDAYFEESEAPFPAASNRPWMDAIFKLAAQHNDRSLLTGLGGNLTISWGGRGLLPQLIRKLRWLQAAHEARALNRSSPSPSAVRSLISSGLFPFDMQKSARYLVRAGREIIVQPADTATKRNVRCFLLGSALAALCHQRGIYPLHANAIQFGDRAFIFAGPSGAGKSTLAFYFNNQGCRVLSDDVCVIGLNAKNNLPSGRESRGSSYGATRCFLSAKIPISWSMQ